MGPAVSPLRLRLGHAARRLEELTLEEVQRDTTRLGRNRRVHGLHCRFEALLIDIVEREFPG